jgi:hypothetical protein
MASAASLLAQIDAAIEALLTGGASSYSIGSRTVTALDLNALFNQRNLLQIQADRESGAGSMFRVAKMQRAKQ